MEQLSQAKVAAFGDSVMWGQGIKHRNKFTTLIAQNIFKLKFTQADNHAHSGAAISSNALRELDQPESIEIPVYGEIPRSKPSIFRQVEKFGLDIPTNAIIPENTDASFPNMELVFLNGGINDIEAINLVTGKAGNLSQLSNLIKKHCEDSFFALMENARKKFPNAQLISIGYHFVLSVDSIREVIEGLGMLGVSEIKTYRKGVSTCHYFMALSTAAFQRAVDRFNAIDLPKGNKGAFFTPTLHNEFNAGFARKSLSWGIENIGSKVFSRLFVALNEGSLDQVYKMIELEDEVDPERRAMCNIYNANKIGANAKCHVASLFHPNSRSARRVFNITSQTFPRFKQNISMRSFLEDSSRGFAGTLNQLGFKSGATLRQVFATDTVASIELGGIVLKSSDSFFPYHQLELRIEVEGKTHRFLVNRPFPAIAGFADGRDCVYPTPEGKVQGGDFNTEGALVRNTAFNFFVFPNVIMPLHKVKKISLVSPKLKDLKTAALNLRNVRLIVNGRSLPLLLSSGGLSGSSRREDTYDLFIKQ